MSRLAIAEAMQSGPSTTARLPIQAKCGLPGLLRRELLSSWAHQRSGPRVTCVALKRIALQEGLSATNTDRLLGDRDHGTRHGDMHCPGALICLQWRIDHGLR